MKIKFTVLTLAAALAIPAMSAHVFKFDNPNAWTRDSKNGAPTSVVMQNDAWGSKTLAPKAEVKIWDFESEDQIADWTFVDSDGDGFNWQYFNMTGVTEGRMTPYEGEGLMASASYDKETTTILYPDNWMISPQVELKGVLKFWAAGQDADYASEVFAVYACVGTPDGVESFVKISDDITATGTYTEYEFSLNQFEGQTGCFAIRHYNVSDMFWLNVDYITLDPDGIFVGLPTELAAEPAATTADVNWTAGENNASWNLRYRPYIDPLMQNRLWDLPYDDEDALNAQLDGWMIYDKDGDGANWGLGESGTSNYAFVSSSYDYNYGGSLTPDNWLVSPVCILGGTVKFDTWNYNATYPEEFEVYVFQGEDWTIDDINNGNFVQVYPHTTVTGTSATAPQAVEVDLSNYTGKGFVAIRHYGTTDQWRFYVDNFEITVPEPAVVPDWIEVDGVENPYTIEELTPETTYEVQVQGVAENGRTSDWTESVLFTTLAEGQEETKYYITGGFNGWLTQDPPELTEEGYTFTAVDDPEGDHPLDFKLLTWGGEDWIWIGGISENEGVDYFDITQGMIDDGIELTLYTDPEGQNFRLPAAGTYTVTLLLEQIRGVVEGAKIVVSKENDPITVGVNDINAKAVAGVKYYNLAGVESNKPFDGVNIMVTTYTDGTKAAAKVIK